jgi:cytochrome P450/NADPH-cytochrome P450 reductase
VDGKRAGSTACVERFRRLHDEKLAEHGAERLYPHGEGDQSEDLDDQFRSWYAKLFDTLAKALNIAAIDLDQVSRGPRYEVEVLPSAAGADALVAEFGSQPLTIAVNRELQTRTGPKPSERSTRHVEFTVPPGLSYREGDHLGILPRIGAEQVRRVLDYFGIPETAQMQIRFNGTGKSFLPVDRPLPVTLLLSGYLALQEAAKRSDLDLLAEYAESPADKAALNELGADDPDSVARYHADIVAKNRSLIDLLEDYPSCKLPFNLFIELVPVLKPRYYSISSSPLASPATMSITVAVVEGPARSGHGIYRGTGSGYLASLAAGAAVEGFIKPPSIPFYPPADPATPMIMVGAGTGIAPFRGFLQARAAMKGRGDKVGPALMFQGCRNANQDHIYADEFAAMERDGVVELEPAFSRPDTGEKQYVQQRLAARRDHVWELIEQGGVIYVCGDAGTMAPAVEQAFIDICRDKRGVSADDAKAWLGAMKADARYLVDIWPKG